MIIKKTNFKGVFEINLEFHKDHRGFFMRTYDSQIFKNSGLSKEWVQENHSYSKKKGTIRGLHFQFPPHTETKIIRVVRGKIFMVVVDLRKDSSSFGKWSSFILSEDNKKMLYISKGFAIGMCTLTDHCILSYKMDEYYEPLSQGRIRWDDIDIGIKWPISCPILCEKDFKAQSFKEFVQKYKWLDIQ